MSSRERWLREFVKEVHSSRRLSPEALNEVLDYIDDVYGDTLSMLGRSVLIFYSIALLHTAKENPVLLERITSELTSILENLSGARGGKTDPRVKWKIRKLLRELKEIAREAIGG